MLLQMCVGSLIGFPQKALHFLVDHRCHARAVRFAGSGIVHSIGPVRRSLPRMSATIICSRAGRSICVSSALKRWIPDYWSINKAEGLLASGVLFVNLSQAIEDLSFNAVFGIGREDYFLLILVLGCCIEKAHYPGVHKIIEFRMDWKGSLHVCCNRRHKGQVLENQRVPACMVILYLDLA